MCLGNGTSQTFSIGYDSFLSFLGNGMNKIYADHAATTPLDEDAYQAMEPYLRYEYGNPSSAHSLGRLPQKAIAESREMIAACIGAEADEIVFTSGGTESDNWAIKGVALKYQNQGRHLITSAIEHHAVLHSCDFLENLGFETTILPVDTEGVVHQSVLEDSLRRGTILVSVMLANNEIGTVQDVAGLSQVARASRCLFHTDAVQVVGHLPVDVKTLGCDLLSASAHKFNGPKGVGFLYIRRGVELWNWLSGGGQEGRRRAGTENVAGIVGMAVALRKNIAMMNEALIHLNRLSTLLLERLTNSGIDYRMNGAKERVPGNVSLSIRGMDGEQILHRLDLRGIAISTGSACNSRHTELSHVIRAIGVPAEYAHGTIRISLGRSNTEEEVIRIADEIIKIVRSIRN